LLSCAHPTSESPTCLHLYPITNPEPRPKPTHPPLQPGEAGPLFAAVFAQLLQQLYEGDVVDEEAFGAWAGEKQHAEAGERVYLDKVRVWGGLVLLGGG
jgi:hypothetical protein